MTKRSLLPRSETKVEPDLELSSPRLWIRKLVILDALKFGAHVVREISFRRGLNIICTEERDSNEATPVGHSVGKSLAVRIIRYCLGEQTFCLQADRGSISNLLPNGFALAEVSVGNDSWVVARPLGFSPASSDSWCLQCNTIEDFLTLQDKRRKYSEFLEAVNDQVRERFAGLTLSYAPREARWIDLLAWLSRDQQCRYRHHNEWRDPDAESGTGQLRREDASMIIRMIMSLFTRKEGDLRAAHEKLIVGKRESENLAERLKNHLEFYEEDLRKSLSLKDDGMQGALFTSACLSEIDKKRRNCEANLRKESEIGGLQLRGSIALQRKLEHDIAIVQSDIQKLEAAIKEKKGEIEQVRKASDDEFFATFDSQAGFCRFFDTKEKALKHGCPGKGEKPQPSEPDPRKEQHVKQLQTRIEQLQTERTVAIGKSEKFELELEKVSREVRLAQKQHDDNLRKIYREQDECDSLERFAKDFQVKHQLLERSQNSIESKKKAIAESLKQQEAERKQIQKKLNMLNECFEFVLQNLLGPSVSGEIEVDSNGIVPKPSSSIASKGEAIATFATVIGFDIACLVAGTRSLGSHPLILIHDSPREADMEETMYHALFKFMVDYEGMYHKKEPAFQYIITTTTVPPKELSTEPWVRLKLDARSKEGLFLKNRF